MTKPSRRARSLRAGAATGVGSLPHRDAGAAAGVSLAVHAELPAAPELPHLHASEGMVDRWLANPSGALDEQAHGGFVAFADAAADDPPPAVKGQVAGPLTLARAVAESGVATNEAIARGVEISTRAAGAVLDLFARTLPHSEPVLFLDEPALVAWTRGDAPIGREEAVDLLSGVLSSVDAVTGVHVCGDGDRRMAIEAGPDIVGFPVSAAVLDDGVALGRYLDAGGWVAWGVIPTDRPVGERVDHWWNELVSVWCDLTRAGCDPVTLRTQALITPACGLAGHSIDQAERILRQCVEIGERVREQAVATRLSLGA